MRLFEHALRSMDIRLKYAVRSYGFPDPPIISGQVERKASVSKKMNESQNWQKKSTMKARIKGTGA